MIKYLVATVTSNSGKVARLNSKHLDQKDLLRDGRNEVSLQNMAGRVFDTDVLHVLGENGWELVTAMVFMGNLQYIFKKSID